MRVLIVVDKIDSAIYRCALAMEHVKDYFQEFNIVSVHPKRPSTDQLETFRRLAMRADIIDFHYWKTADMLIRSFGFLKKKKKIVVHHNPYDLSKMDWWDHFDDVVVRNKTQKKIIESQFNKKVRQIPLSIDLNFFKFQREYPKDDVFKAIMVAARIEGKKGILEVAKACRQTKTKLILVGRISDMNYFKEIATVAGDYLDFRQNISEEDLRNAYYEANIFINNSVDNFESGTLPHLEAMACGVPVLTREVGTVPDIANDRNMVIRPGKKEDVDEIAKFIKDLKENRLGREKLREQAFNTVLSKGNEYTARRFYRLYREILFGSDPLVSVIIPTYNRKASLLTVLASLTAQTYENIEAIVIDDGSDDGTKQVMGELKEISSLPHKYIQLTRRGYGLARARNTGVVEANGKILVFIDDRFLVNSRAIEIFVQTSRDNAWLFGDKGANKKSFVENFSCIYKKDLVKMGMFNERIETYGGMTRDLVNRMRFFGIEYIYCPEAKVDKVLIPSKSRYAKKPDIIKSKLLLWKLWGGE